MLKLQKFPEEIIFGSISFHMKKRELVIKIAFFVLCALFIYDKVAKSIYEHCIEIQTHRNPPMGSFI